MTICTWRQLCGIDSYFHAWLHFITYCFQGALPWLFLIIISRYVSFSRYTIYHVHTTYNILFFQSHNVSHPVNAIFMHDFTLSHIVFGMPCHDCSYLLSVGTCLSPDTLFITYIRSISCLSFRTIMDLTQKFDGVTCDTTVSVSELDVNRKYRILRAKRLTTRFSPTVILTVKNGEAAPVQIILPRRYSDVFTDTGIEQINSNAVLIHSVFKGVCWDTKAYLLTIVV